MDKLSHKGMMRRRGWRGRWLTIYLHKYAGDDKVERMHSHPWRIAFGIVLRGFLIERRSDVGRVRREFLSMACYTRKTRHLIERGNAITLFVGLLRTQKLIEKDAEVRTKEGYCHYTEVTS